MGDGAVRRGVMGRFVLPRPLAAMGWLATAVMGSDRDRDVSDLEPVGVMSDGQACAAARVGHSGRSSRDRSFQCHHGRRRRRGRLCHHHRGRARGLAHGRPPPSGRAGRDILARPVFAGYPFLQRQRRDDGLALDRRARPAHHADRHYQHPQRGSRARWPSAPTSCAMAGDAPVAAAGRRRGPIDGRLSDSERLAVHHGARGSRPWRVPPGGARSRRENVGGRHRRDLATSSRAAPAAPRALSTRAARATPVGALVQANYGQRELLRVDGVPVGEAGRDR